MIERHADVLNRLPFVCWDRYVEIPDGDLDVYGWIDREDGRADFVILTFAEADPDFVGFTTSSSEHSEEIGRLIHGEDDAEHYPCQRVEHAGVEIENVVRL